MIVCIPVDDAGAVGPHWGRAHAVALAGVENGELVSWDVHEVGWDIAHDAGTHASHHARIVRFLREHGVTAIVAGGMGAGMQQVVGKLGLALVLGASGDARRAVLDAVPLLLTA